MLNPWDGNYRISCDWTCHITRTPPSSGGTDYAMSVGTPILASFDGVLTNRPPVQYPASGNVAILTRADGVAFYHLHLSRFVTEGPKREGENIGYSGGAAGAPGSGSSTGPHLHVNAYDTHGNARDIHDYYGPDTASTGPLRPITPTPTPPPEEENTMKNKFFIVNDGSALYVGAPGMTKLIHILSPDTLAILRALLAGGEAPAAPLAAVQEVEAIMAGLPA